VIIVVVRETDRLRLRHLALGDAPFIVALLNDPDWLRYIGDRGVRTIVLCYHTCHPCCPPTEVADAR
jgi:hypothetical protein